MAGQTVDRYRNQAPTVKKKQRECGGRLSFFSEASREPALPLRKGPDGWSLKEKGQLILPFESTLYVRVLLACLAVAANEDSGVAVVTVAVMLELCTNP